MIQPKYGFENLFAAKLGKVIRVDKIELVEGVFWYSDANWKAPENDLRPHKEPVTLYAWSSHDGVVFHVTNEKSGPEVFHRIGIDAQNFKRAPEFDIEIPSTVEARVKWVSSMFNPKTRLFEEKEIFNSHPNL